MGSNPTLSFCVNNDIHHYDKKLRYKFRKLNMEKFCEQDKKFIAGYVRFLETQGLNKGRLAKAVCQLRTLRRYLS